MQLTISNFSKLWVNKQHYNNSSNLMTLTRTSLSNTLLTRQPHLLMLSNSNNIKNLKISHKCKTLNKRPHLLNQKNQKSIKLKVKGLTSQISQLSRWRKLSSLASSNLYLKMLKPCQLITWVYQVANLKAITLYSKQLTSNNLARQRIQLLSRGNNMSTQRACNRISCNELTYIIFSLELYRKQFLNFQPYMMICKIVWLSILTLIS